MTPASGGGHQRVIGLSCVPCDSSQGHRDSPVVSVLCSGRAAHGGSLPVTASSPGTEVPTSWVSCLSEESNWEAG